MPVDAIIGMEIVVLTRSQPNHDLEGGFGDGHSISTLSDSCIDDQSMSSSGTGYIPIILPTPVKMSSETHREASNYPLVSLVMLGIALSLMEGAAAAIVQDSLKNEEWAPISAEEKPGHAFAKGFVGTAAGYAAGILIGALYTTLYNSQQPNGTAQKNGAKIALGIGILSAIASQPIGDVLLNEAHRIDKPMNDLMVGAFSQPITAVGMGLLACIWITNFRIN